MRFTTVPLGPMTARQNSQKKTLTFANANSIRCSENDGHASLNTRQQSRLFGQLNTLTPWLCTNIHNVSNSRRIETLTQRTPRAQRFQIRESIAAKVVGVKFHTSKTPRFRRRIITNTPPRKGLSVGA
jgi:hypothetical protein